MKTLTFLILSLLFINASGQAKISGNIINNKKTAIAGANIYLEGSYDGTTSAKEGNFMFTPG